MMAEYGEYSNYVSDVRMKPSEVSDAYDYYVPEILPATIFAAIRGDLYAIQAKLLEPTSTLDVMNDINKLIAKLS